MKFLTRATLLILILPLLAVAQPDKPAPADKTGPEQSVPTQKPNAKLPSAREVIDRFVKAAGGREAVEKIEYTRITAKIEMAGLSGSVHVFAAKPDKFLVRMNIADSIKTSAGSDGKVAWTMDPVQGPMLLEGTMADQVRQEGNLLTDLHEEKDYESMETVDAAPFQGKECYKLKLVKKNGQELTEYFEVATGLLVGRSAQYETPLGAINATSRFSEYKKYGEVLLPSKMTQSVSGIQQVMTVTSVEFTKFDEAIFKLPPEIATLSKK